MLIDTSSIVRILSKSGIEPKRAQAHAEAIARAIEKQQESLATKEFVDSRLTTLETEMKASNERLETKMEASNERLETKMEASNERLETKIDTSIERLETKMDTSIEGFKTKIDTLAKEFKASMAELEAKTDAKMASQESRLIRWMVATTLSTAGILFALLRIFPS